jgi:transglutaminase-like putative cysteine protease
MAVLPASPATHAAEEVIRVAPDTYVRDLAPLVTPLNAVRNLDTRQLEEKAPAITLLDERLYRVEPDGRRTMVFNIVRKSITDAGAKANDSEIFSIRKKEQRFYLLLAETIQQDGTAQPVKEDAVLVNSPQRQAQYALYDDVSEIRILFPNVKPGSITHVLAITEDTRARMPGEFTENFTWYSSWPIGRIRYSVDLPGEMAGRLQIHTVGSEVTAPERTNIAGDRVRFLADRILIPPAHDEATPAPASQVGPCLRFSTIADWSAVGRWYGGLLNERGRLSPALAAKVDEFTKNETTKEGIVRVLFEKVANDVRYTGLELGAADYQPHDCNAVWDNQYGDCKDKANLLVAFLRHKGVAANVALLNAEHAGLIDRRSPDYRVFNHAIVAVPDDRGGYTFCDPTIAKAGPEILSPGDADRDILVVGNGSSEWVHSPPQAGGREDFRFDMTLKASGELSGWLTTGATGFFGASDEDGLEKLDARESRQAAGELVRMFFPGAEVVDVVKGKHPAPSEAYTFKVYFDVPRSAETGSGKQTFLFPKMRQFFDGIGYSPERTTAFFLRRGRWSVTCSIDIPPGFSAGDLPEPFDVENPAGTMRASWRISGANCRAELVVDVAQSLLGPDEFKTYYAAAQSLQAWMEKPVIFSLTGSKAVAAASRPELDDFPMMPTGEGQLTLLEKRYPYGSNPALRRAALDRILQYFPDDKPTVFRASVLKAIMDFDAGESEKVAKRLQILLPAYRASLDPNTNAWGEEVFALCLEKLNRAGEAVSWYADIAQTAGLRDEMRNAGALGAAKLLRKTDRARALELLAPAVARQAPNQPAVCSLLARILLENQQSDVLHQRLAEIFQSEPGGAGDLAVKIAEGTGDWSDAEDAQLPQKLASILTDLRPQDGPKLAKAAAEAAALGKFAQAMARIQTRLREGVEKPPLADWYAPIRDDSLKTDADFDTAVKNSSDGGDLNRAVGVAVEAVLVMPPDVNLPKRLFRALTFADMKTHAPGAAPTDAVLESLLLDLGDYVPDTDIVYFAMKLTHAKIDQLKGDALGEQAILRLILANPKVTSLVRAYALLELGTSLEGTGDFEGAARVYGDLEPYASGSSAYASGILRAVFINLQLGRDDDALREIQTLESAGEKIVAGTESAGQIRDFIALRRTGKAREYWTPAGAGGNPGCSSAWRIRSRRRIELSLCP